MAFGSTFQNDLAKLVFQATAIANIADNAASSPLTSLYLSLHTADPSGGSQTTSEVGYTSYARVAVVRTSSGWTVTGNVVTPTSSIAFPASTGGSTGTATYAAVGTAASGSGKVLVAGPITPNIPYSTGTTPTLDVGSTITLT